MKITTKIDQFRGETDGEFMQWCFRIARGTAADYYRRPISQRAVALPPEEIERLADAGEQVEGNAGTGEDIRRLMAILRELPDECRLYLTLY